MGNANEVCAAPCNADEQLPRDMKCVDASRPFGLPDLEAMLRLFEQLLGVWGRKAQNFERQPCNHTKTRPTPRTCPAKFRDVIREWIPVAYHLQDIRKKSSARCTRPNSGANLTEGAPARKLPARNFSSARVSFPRLGNQGSQQLKTLKLKAVWRLHLS